eukprot:scaffold4.g4629.t1
MKDVIKFYTLRNQWGFLSNFYRRRRGLVAKFAPGSALAAKLLATGNATLVEHTANDSVWCDGGDGSGENRLESLLMDVRESLRHHQQAPGGGGHAAASGAQAAQEAAPAAAPGGAQALAPGAAQAAPEAAASAAAPQAVPGVAKVAPEAAPESAQAETPEAAPEEAPEVAPVAKKRRRLSEF